MIGRRAGEVVPDASLKALSMRLLRNRVNLVRNADEALDAAGAGGLFRVYKDGSASILLRKNATYYEVAHELRHYEHYLRIGADAYKKLSPLVREQQVYDALRNSHRWLQMTADEIKHAQQYIKKVGGDAW
ncbi:zincin-like metallopeptidase toxin domain-containing protein [Pirellulaceae bacterium SH449]